MNRVIRLYTKAAKYMDTLLQVTHFNQVEKEHPQHIQSQQLLVDSLNNIVAVCIQYETTRIPQGQTSGRGSLETGPQKLERNLGGTKAALLDPASTMEEVKAALEAAESEITYKNRNEEK
jgi:hypothetical protein